MKVLLKNAVLSLVEKAGYRVFSRSVRGVSLPDDLHRLITNSAPNVIDAGANCGQTIRWIKARFPHARIWSYEPDPRVYPALQAEAACHADVECVPAALGARAGLAEFFCNESSVTSSLLKSAGQTAPAPYHAALQTVQAVEAEIRTVSAEIERLRLSRVHLLKTDCQGFDFEVLKGAEADLGRGHIDTILTEVLFYREYDGQAWFHEILPWLEQKEYVFHGLYDVYHADNGRALFANALFKHTPAASGESMKHAG